MNASWLRKSLLGGLVLLVASLGPGVLAGAPRAMSLGSEEEVRHTDTEVIGCQNAVRFRPPRGKAASDRIQSPAPARSAIRADGDGCLSIVIARSLHALQIRIEV